MTIDEAIKQLEYLKNAEGGELKLKIFIQTGPDSWEWREVTYMEAKVFELGEIGVDITY